MPAENYKKWTIGAVAILIAGIVIFALSTSDHKQETPSQTQQVPPGPLTVPGVQEQLQIDKLPDNPQELASLGDKYFESSRFDLAVQVYEKVLQKNPTDADTYNDMGLALYYMRRADDAVNILKKGTEVAPSYQRLWLSLGFVLVSTGRNEEAKTALKKTAELNPQNDIGQEAMRMLGSIK